ncbi:MAG: DUF2785 domain-containing protein [Defluviitaleaceae bacterium]|nr:DUF2785 domain-containing protein [Defluviitaleaceae bacterium]
MDFKEKMSKYAEMSLKNLKALNGEEITLLIDDILGNFASSSAELRYDVMYPILNKLISKNVLSEKEFSRLLKLCLDEQRLFYNLGQKGDDSVFTRAFSSLTLYILLDANRKKQVFSVPEIDNAFERILQYAEREVDTRGYVEGKGWAFAVAHTADMLQALVQNPLITQENYRDILGAVKSCLFKEGPYVDGEIDRLATVAKLIMEKGFVTDALEAWMKSLVVAVDEIKEKEGATYQHFRINANVNNFLRSLYFQFKKSGDRVKLRVSIFELIKIM